MNTSSFQRTAVATAVSAVLTAGMAGTAYAANLAATGQGKPTLAGAPFLGADLTKFRVAATTAAVGDDGTARFYFFDDAGVQVGTPSVAVLDTSVGVNVELNLTVNTPAGATQAAVIIGAGVGDDVNGDGFGYVDATDGTLVGAVDEATAVADAVAGGAGLMPIDPSYTSISIASAQVDLDPGAKVIYVTYNADPNISETGEFITSSGIADRVTVKAGITGKDTISSNRTFPGTPGFGLPENIRVLMWDDTVVNNPNLDLATIVAFDAQPTSIENATGLDDDAGNSVINAGLVSPIPPLAPPNYAGAGQVAVEFSGDADALYDGGDPGQIFINVRMNEALNAGSVNDATRDYRLTVDGSDVTGATFNGNETAVVDDNGDLTIVRLNVDAPALWFIDPATGNLLHGVDRDSAGLVEVEIIPDPNPPTTPPGPPQDSIALALNTSVRVNTELGPQQVVAGQAQAAQLITQDDDKDGWVDGGVLDFRQALTVPFPGGGNVGLVSYTGNPEVLVSSFAAGANAPEVLLLLANPDVPNPDGTAPAVAQNDFNGDAVVDAADAALVVGDNFNTGVFNTKVGAGDGLPFEAYVGIDALSPPTPPTSTTPTTSLTYANVYHTETGLNLGIPTGPVAFSVDGADPVVKAVEFSGGNAIVRASEDVQARPFIADSTRDAINEFLFGGVTADLVNLGADPALPPVQIEIGTTDNPDLVIGHGGDEIILTNMPPSIIGQTLSLGVTGGAEDLAGNPLFLLPGVQNDVVEPDPEGPMVTAVRAAEVGGKWDRVVVTFDQPLATPAGQTSGDLDAVFTVRAIIGWDATGGAAADNMEVFQWIIAGADVSYGTAAGNIGGLNEVTLKLPGSNVLPPDTVQVFADYQGASEMEVDDGSLSFVGNILGAPAKIDGGSQFDDDDTGVGTDVPMQFTVTGDTTNIPPAPPAFGDTEGDEDTAISQIYEADFIELGGRDDDQRRLFTQTIKGAVTNGGEQAFEGTAVRADVIRLNTDPGVQKFEKKAAVGDGWVEVRQGSNSEYSDEGTSDNDSDDNNWVNMALKNQNGATPADFNDFATSVKNIEDKEEIYDSAVHNNKSQNEINTAYANWQKAEIAHERKYGLSRLAPRYLLLTIAVTAGDGKATPGSAFGSDYQDNEANSAQANGNASFGRTATLTKGVPNKMVNGTSYYPVWLDLENGVLEDASGSALTRNIRNGGLAVVLPELGEKAKEMTYFEQLDTAYALVDAEGNYKITVSMDQNALTAKSKDLNVRYDDACILIKVKNTTRNSPQAGDWLQANSCEPSFESYRHFTSDLYRDGTATMLNINVDNISRTHYIDDGDWFLAAIAGTPARDDSKPVDLPSFFLQTRPSDGATVSLWGADHGYGDSVATLGLNEDKEPYTQLAFELGDENDNSEVGSLNPRPGGALAILGDGEKRFYQTGTTAGPPPGDLGTTANDDDTGGAFAQDPAYDPADSDEPNRELLDDDSEPAGGHMLYVPVTGAAQDARLDGEAWHLVTFNARGKTLQDIVDTYPAVGAMIIFHNPVSHLDTGRDDLGDNDLDGDVDTTVWFAGETPPPTVLGDPIGAFIYANDVIDPFNVDIP